MQSFVSCMAEEPKILKPPTSSSFNDCGLRCIPSFAQSWFVYFSKGGENCLKGTGFSAKPPAISLCDKKQEVQGNTQSTCFCGSDFVCLTVTNVLPGKNSLWGS